MIIYIDANTLALTTAGQVPLTDMALVRGDKMPLRIVLTDGPGTPSNSDEVPVLAVKKSLGDDSLVLAATGLEHVWRMPWALLMSAACPLIRCSWRRSWGINPGLT